MANREENLKKINDQLELMSDEELEKMTDEELEQVAGGEVRELRDLAMEIVEGPFGKGFAEFSMHIPGANIPFAYEVEKALEDNYGIEADISVGFGGTGIASVKNTYKNILTGKTMTHREVMAHIRNVNGMFGR